VKHMSYNLFGTDGIRGLVDLAKIDAMDAIIAILEKRTITPMLLKIIGKSLGVLVSNNIQSKPKVVIGWDNRPGNLKLVEYLTIGLNKAPFEVIHIGQCATPTLHLATLAHSAMFGCMITASHNPVEDSGLKIFDSQGYKTTPEFEQRLSKIAVDLAQQDMHLDSDQSSTISVPSKQYQIEQWSIPRHRAWLELRVSIMRDMLGFDINKQSIKVNNPLFIDSSKGTASLWFADWLTEWGIESVEVSRQAAALNLNCGAGDFSPTDSWTFEEAKQSSHLLLQRLPACEPGMIVAGAFDGDGDRCLLIESTTNGFQVIDGDRIADTIVNSMTNSGFDWAMAASIESDLSLSSNLDRFAKQVRIYETAVGDRWLSFKLSNHFDNKRQLLKYNAMPQILGVEDSGHIVLPAPNPVAINSWSLVGDGTMTLMAYLLAIEGCDNASLMKPGWKLRQSVKGVDRRKWDGKNQLSNEIESMLNEFLSKHNIVEDWQRTSVEGEPNLVLINMKFGGKKLSIGIRNSGTQEKISVSARLEYGGSNVGLQETLELICQHLSEKMTIH